LQIRPGINVQNTFDNTEHTDKEKNNKIMNNEMNTYCEVKKDVEHYN